MSVIEQPVSNSPLREKWGEALNGGFLVIPSALLRHQYQLSLECGETLVLLNLLMSWWKSDDLPFPQTSTLAKRMGVSRRTVQRHIESLEGKGLIRRIWNSARQADRRATARYDLSGIVAELKRLGSVPHSPRRVEITDGKGGLDDTATRLPHSQVVEDLH